MTAIISASIAGFVAANSCCDSQDCDNSDSSGLIYASGTVTSAELFTANQSAVPLIAAAGTGKLIVLKSVILQLVNGSILFTGGGGVYLQYGPGQASNLSATGVILTGTNVLGSEPNVSYVNSGFCEIGADLTGASPFPATLCPFGSIVNNSVCLSNRAAAFATGNGYINWTIAYTVIDVQNSPIVVPGPSLVVPDSCDPCSSC